MDRLLVEQFEGRIDELTNFAKIRTLRDEIHTAVHASNTWTALDTYEHNECLNRLHDKIIQRAVTLTEQHFLDSGMGPPPASYAFVMFGSGGRGEQTLWSDQDNGLIYADVPDALQEQAAAYFTGMCHFLSDVLQQLGYPPCDGNVLCTNEQWRQPLSGWMAMMQGWLSEPVWENVRYLLILADMRCISGEAGLASLLKRELLDYIAAHPAILNVMLQNTLHHKVSLGLFGQLITERYGEDAGGFDVKYGAYIPMVNGFRLLALQSGIADSQTCARIAKLEELNKVEAGLLQAWLVGFSSALKLRLMTPFQVENGIYSSRGFIQLSELSKRQRHELKSCLKAGIELQKYVKRKFDHELEKG
ncbi:DUF294 nucleotidyltransferase-like domain-containing protein [Paenibacillus sp. y28]|uniref:DUF294 nucleotidyltransferase-like domain-containing protein n=1 Tax=Paenibacillus sp. y28 TaxID=3129110 RepID=UPI00301695A9